MIFQEWEVWIVVAGMTMSLDGFVHDRCGGAVATCHHLSDRADHERGRASVPTTGASVKADKVSTEGRK